MSQTENVELNDLVFEINPIPRIHLPETPRYWECYGYAAKNGLYCRKGVTYLPNYYERGTNGLEKLKYLINNDEEALRHVLESLSHEYLHKWLDFEFGAEICHQFDNIDKRTSEYGEEYVLTAIQGSLWNLSEI